MLCCGRGWQRPSPDPPFSFPSSSRKCRLARSEVPLDDLESVRELGDAIVRPSNFISPDEQVGVIGVPVGRITPGCINGIGWFRWIKSKPDKFIGKHLGIGCIVSVDRVVASTIAVKPKADRCSVRVLPISSTSILTRKPQIAVLVNASPWAVAQGPRVLADACGIQAIAHRKDVRNGWALGLGYGDNPTEQQREVDTHGAGTENIAAESSSASLERPSSSAA